MNKRCKGCGAILQNTNADFNGFTPKLDAEYCQRCFRLTHYNDVVVSKQKDIDNDKIFAQLSDLNVLILWVVDLFDFESCMIEGLNRHLAGKDIIMVATKRDLLPASIGNHKIVNFIQKRLKFYGINVKAIVICGDLAKHPFSDENYSLDAVNEAVLAYRDGRDVAVIGSANAGKSTMLNGLLKDSVLTTSYHPGTTLEINPIKTADYILYDTPGLVRMHSLLTHIDDKLLKQVIPAKEIKPAQFQLNGDQSLAVGGLARLDIAGCEKASVVCYFSEYLSIHRGKLENADRLWNEQLGKMLIPSMSESYDMLKHYSTKSGKKDLDIVINGLGFFTIKGKYNKIDVYVEKTSDVVFREAMI